MNRIGGYKAGRMPDDVVYKKAGKIKQLPQKVDLRKFLTSIERQVGNSCVANAFAGAYEYLAKRENGDSADVSRLFIYYNARAVEGEEAVVFDNAKGARCPATRFFSRVSEEVLPFLGNWIDAFGGPEIWSVFDLICLRDLLHGCVVAQNLARGEVNRWRHLGHRNCTSPSAAP